MNTAYLWLIFALLVIATVVVIFFASRAVSQHNRQTREALEQLKRLKSLKDKYKSVTSEAALQSEPEELLEGMFAVLEARLEKSEDPEAEFKKLSKNQQGIYALYCFKEDTESSLSFFFSNNTRDLINTARAAINELEYKDFLTWFNTLYDMYDEDNEQASLDRDASDSCDRSFAEAFDRARFFQAVKKYIVSGLTD
ncbi:MAG: hypothetical protein IJL63_02165 [Clostridia bacterium]|nr:hypothetical protein [Clostridia bacterium]